MSKKAGAKNTSRPRLNQSLVFIHREFQISETFSSLLKAKERFFSLDSKCGGGFLPRPTMIESIVSANAEEQLGRKWARKREIRIQIYLREKVWASLA